MLLCLVLGSCKSSLKEDANTQQSTGNILLDNLRKVSASGQPVANGIEINGVGGIKVTAAFLMLETGELIYGPQNNIKPGDKIRLLMQIDGWLDDGGKVAVGAGQVLTNSDHRVMIKEPDLFAGAGPLPKEDASYISLLMEVLNLEKIYDYYQVDFTVWNKQENQKLHGRYRFKIKQ